MLEVGHPACLKGLILTDVSVNMISQMDFLPSSADLTPVGSVAVVSQLWGKQCVRLKVIVKSDNCGENADCSNKGVCFSNISMVSRKGLYGKFHVVLKVSLPGFHQTFQFV